jgi:hypothetical protein
MLPELKIAQLRYFVLVAEHKISPPPPARPFAPSLRYPGPA